ncbi:hypothetical protein ACR742_18205 [Flavonifractor plautii]|uniref:YjcQ protein n=1 Tax=Flavonifractor plautii ATCC 29863 TaxID=411475 RepID=G9YSE7_FLAPL|nr:hypothetical protein [Flavonifractor plautii]EHM46143.1 hypothetical protein HMPREF0372_02424 [Flavonifractor plautii ATCC 29863]QIA30971.1 hypothetical protein GXM20_10540 [Flavonifractor plautii]
MSDVKLTKDADALICALYKEYLQKRKDGKPKGEAKDLGGAEHIQQTIVPKWQLGDVEETLWELGRAGLLVCHPGDNTVYFAILADEGIIYMENRFRNGLSDVLGYIEKIKSILLW